MVDVGLTGFLAGAVLGFAAGAVTALAAMRLVTDRYLLGQARQRVGE